MAKIEGFLGRSAALAEDDLQDGFYRPASASKSRPETGSQPRPAPRFQPEPPDEDAFLRTPRRVPVRKGLLPRSRVGQAAVAAGALTAAAGFTLLSIAAHNLLKHDPRFRIDSSASIQIQGNSEVTRPELLSVFGSDIGRNVFFIPLADRRADLERLPWVEHATVMRLLPNQLRVAIVERVPVAFVRTGNEIALVDASGVILPMPPAASSAAVPAKHYSFPVVTGIDAGDPLSTRTARMHIYQRFLSEIDASGENVSAQLSEVDLSDPEDVKAIIQASGSDILLHFGDQEFLARYHNYQAHLAEWRQQYPRLTSVDLRYERQVVLEMSKDTAVTGQDLAPASAPAADPHEDPKLQQAKVGRVKVNKKVAAKARAKSPHRPVRTVRPGAYPVAKPGISKDVHPIPAAPAGETAQ